MSRTDPAPARVDGLHVEATGEGPPVILAHGFGGSARNFRPQARALRDRARVVAYDARGHARSAGAAPDGWTPTLSDLADDMERVVDAVVGHEAPVVAGGLSLGAATALAFARRHPDRVRGLVLLSPPPARHRPGSLGASALAFAEALERDGLEAAGARFVWGPDSGLDERGARLVRQGFLEHDADALARLLRGVVAELSTPDEIASELSALATPTLLVTGGADAGSVETADALAAALPDAQHVRVEGAGHVVNLEAAETVSRRLAEWLDRTLEGWPIPSSP